MDLRITSVSPPLPSPLLELSRCDVQNEGTSKLTQYFPQTLHHIHFTCNYGQYFTWADKYVSHLPYIRYVAR